jgi:hypothetical protein
MPEATYGQLDELLRSLEFSVHEPEPGTRVYRHSSDALVILPIRVDQDLVPVHHMVGTRMILDAFGIMEPPEFTSRLQKAG